MYNVTYDGSVLPQNNSPAFKYYTQGNICTQSISNGILTMQSSAGSWQNYSISNPTPSEMVIEMRFKCYGIYGTSTRGLLTINNLTTQYDTSLFSDRIGTYLTNLSEYIILKIILKTDNSIVTYINGVEISNPFTKTIGTYTQGSFYFHVCDNAVLNIDYVNISWNNDITYSKYLKSLLQFENGLVDYNNKTWTSYNSATINSSQKKFGNNSLYLNGTNQYINISHSSDFEFMNSDFSIECYIYPLCNNKLMFIACEHNYGSLGSYYLTMNSSGQLQSNLYWGSDTKLILTSDTIVPINTWSHIYIGCKGTTAYLGLNGIIKTGAIIRPLVNPNSEFNIGRQTNNSYFFNGYIDEFCIYNGITKYTSNYILPTETIQLLNNYYCYII